MCSLIYNTATLYFVKFFHILSCAKRFICYWSNKFPLFQDVGCSESGDNFSGMMNAMVDRTRWWRKTMSWHLLLLISKLSFNLQNGTAFSTCHCHISSWNGLSSSIGCEVLVAYGHLWGRWWRWCWILVVLGGGLTRISFRLLHRQLTTAAAGERAWWLTQWPLLRSASLLGGIPFGWTHEPLALGTEWDAWMLWGLVEQGLCFTINIIRL